MADYYASSGGSAGGDGSLGDPWDLATAFAATATVGAGDTLWLMEQSYTGRFTVALSGTDDANRVEVRPYDGYVVFDMVGSAAGTGDQGMIVTGDFVDLWDIWVTSSNTNRWQPQEDDGWNITGNAVRVFFGGAYDTGANGVSFFSAAQGGLLHGMTIFSNGYDDTDRGHGPGVYTQNDGTLQKVIDLCSFGFQMGPQSIQAYTGGGDILNYLIKRNVCPQRLLLGGFTLVDDGEVDENHVLSDVLQVGFGTSGFTNETALVTDNITPDGTVVQVGTWNDLTVSGTVDGAARNAVDIIASEYDSNRAIVVVYDADGDGVVPVDLTGLSLTEGTEYVLAHYLNPLAQGYTFTWDGQSPVYVRTDASWVVANPLGHDGADEGSQVSVPPGSAPENRMAFILAPSARWPATLTAPSASNLGGISVSTPTLDTATMWSIPKHVEANGDFTDLTGNDRHTMIRSNSGHGDTTRDPLMQDDATYGPYARLFNGTYNAPLLFPYDAAWAPDNRSFTILLRGRIFASGWSAFAYLFGNHTTAGWGVAIDDRGGQLIQIHARDGTNEAAASTNGWWVPKIGELWEYMLTWDNTTGKITLYVSQPEGLPAQLLTATNASLIGADMQPSAENYSTALSSSLLWEGATGGGYNSDARGRLDWFGWAKFAGTILTPAQGQTAFAEMAAANTATSRRGLPGHRAPWIGVGIGV